MRRRRGSRKNPAVVEALIPTLVKRLIEAGAGDAAGQTPLHLAALKNENPAVVEALLDGGADPKARSEDGRLPFDFAKSNEALKGTDVYWRLNEARFKE